MRSRTAGQAADDDVCCFYRQYGVRRAAAFAREAKCLFNQGGLDASEWADFHGNVFHHRGTAIIGDFYDLREKRLADGQLMHLKNPNGGRLVMYVRQRTDRGATRVFCS
jgi:hypothetical protein